MYIYQQVNFSEFYDQFMASRPDNFSYEALESLFEYFDNLAVEMDRPIELDVIAICCEYSEDTFADIAENYEIDISDCEGDEDCIADEVISYLENNTTVITTLDNTVVYAQF